MQRNDCYASTHLICWAVASIEFPLRTRLVDCHVLVTGARDPVADLQGLRSGD